MKYYTLNDIMELKPCHSRGKLEEYMKGRKRISLSGILNSKASDADKIWLVVRLLPTDKTTKFAKWCADSVSHIDNAWAACADTYAADAAVDAARAAAYATKAADAAVDADAAYAAHDAHDAARKEQVNQLKLIVEENKL